MSRLLVLVLLAGCWRDSAPAQDPASFVARVHVRAEIERQLAAYAKRIEVVFAHIELLRNETERHAMAEDLHAIDRALTAISRRPELTETLQGELRRVRTALEHAREELALATSAEERAARAQLDKQPEPQAPALGRRGVQRTILLRIGPQRELPDELP